MAANVLIIAAYALVCHGVMLLNDGVLWDGWLLDSWQRNRNWPVMRRFYAEVGLAPFYYLHKFLSGVPARIFVYRLITFASTLASALAVYFLGLHGGILGEFNSLLLALLYLSYTGYHMNVDTVVGLQYTLPTAFFYWAAYLALVSADHTGFAHAAPRIAALVLFFAAFNANSILVYYFGFLALKFLSGWDRADDAGTNLYRLLIGHVDFVLLPFAYWFLKNRLTPRHGHYEQYNRIQPHPLRLVWKLIGAIRYGLEAPISAPVRSAAAGQYLWVPLLAFAVTLGLYTSHPFALMALPTASLLTAGSVLFLLAALPYALVGQSFFPEGWGTKHHMLFHLPVSMILLAALAWLPPALTLATLAFVLVCNAIRLNLVSLHHLAVSVKNWSWLRKLARAPGARDTSIFLVADCNSIRGDPSNHDQEHRTAYLFHMLEWAWGDKTRCGIPVAPNLAERLAKDRVSQEIVRSTIDYDMQQVHADGRQAKVTIADGIDRSASHVALLYLRHRYLRGGNIEALLESVTEINFVEL